LNHYSIAKQAKEMKTRIHHDSERYDETFRVGVEIEACLLDDNGMPVNANPLIKELEGTKYKVDYEYGICQFEYKTLPTPMDRLLDLNTEIEEFIEYLDKSIQKVWRNNNNEVIPVFLGCNPSSLIFKDGLITDKPRYNQLARWQSKIPDVEIDGQKLKALHVATAIQGFHLHLQAQNPVHTAQMFNHILNLIPSAIVLGANSRLLGGKIYSLHEPRIHLYDQSEQQNSGFPTIPKYLDDIDDYMIILLPDSQTLPKIILNLKKNVMMMCEFA
jgi:gamma-glutamylcysteine synthetase